MMHPDHNCPWPFYSCSCIYPVPLEKTMSERCELCESGLKEGTGISHAHPMSNDEPKCDVLGQPVRREKGQAEPPRYAIPILRHFKHDHLPPRLAEVSALFGDVAIQLTAKVQYGPERQVALRKLLEAKDAAVRAVMEESP